MSIRWWWCLRLSVSMHLMHIHITWTHIIYVWHCLQASRISSDTWSRIVTWIHRNLAILSAVNKHFKVLVLIHKNGGFKTGAVDACNPSGRINIQMFCDSIFEVNIHVHGHLAAVDARLRLYVNGVSMSHKYRTRVMRRAHRRQMQRGHDWPG